MKLMKRMHFVLAALLLASFMFVACGGPDLAESSPPVSTPEQTDPIDSSPLPAETIYTVEQIQAALDGYIIGPGGVNALVVSVKKVEMDRDSITYGEVSQQVTFDLTHASRYEVTYEIKFESDLLYRTSIVAGTDEVVEVLQWHADDYIFDGDFVIFTHVEYYYFNDENGNPVIAAWYC